MPWIPTGGGDADAIHDNVAGEIDAITEKTTPVDADIVIIEDSEDSFNKKKVEVGNLPAGSSSGAANMYRHADPPGSPDAWDEEFGSAMSGSWLNQSTANVSTSDNAMTLYDSRNANNVSMYGKSPPAGSYTVETMIYPYMADDTTNRSGGFLAVRYSSTINVCGLYLNKEIRTLTFASNGTGTATAQSSTFFDSNQFTMPLFVRAAWDNGAGSLTWSVSPTGVTNSWFQVHSFTPGSTPDLVGAAGIWERNHLIAYSFEYLRKVA